MKKGKIYIGLMVLISVILCLPSILYLINNKTVDGFDGYYTYTLIKSQNKFQGTIAGIVIIGLLLIFSVFYFYIIKNNKEIFTNKKQIFLFVIIISFIFMMILPYLSSDIFYYMGDGWLLSKYKQNPYYVSVAELQAQGINDEILNNTGYWKETTSVYGPLWSIIAAFLVSLSFGNVTISLFIFKFASFLVHILNCYLIYKITKSHKYILLYGLNPLILLEFLGNVHNDIYLLLFMLIALYFLIRKKNIYLGMLFLALSISIKYSTALIVPFILIYCFRNKTIPKRILCCMISGLSIVASVILLYMPFFRDFTIFTNMLVQGKRFSQSIQAFLLTSARDIFNVVNKIALPTFMIMYICLLITLVFKRKVSFKELMKKYNFIMLIFIFVVLTNFQKWYILWLIPTIIWQSKYMRRFILYLTATAIIPSLKYFQIGVDAYIYGIHYSIMILIFSIIASLIYKLYEIYYKSKLMTMK